MLMMNSVGHLSKGRQALIAASAGDVTANTLESDRSSSSSSSSDGNSSSNESSSNSDTSSSDSDMEDLGLDSDDSVKDKDFIPDSDEEYNWEIEIA